MRVGACWIGTGDPARDKVCLKLHSLSPRPKLGILSHAKCKHWKRAISENVAVLARVKIGLILKPIERLRDGSYLAKIYPSPYDRKKDRNGMTVRVIRYMLDDPQRVGHEEEHVLLTTLLDEQTYPASELVPLYHERWEIELTYDEQKTHVDSFVEEQLNNLLAVRPNQRICEAKLRLV